jgi:hypothetical protein
VILGAVQNVDWEPDFVLFDSPIWKHVYTWQKIRSEFEVRDQDADAFEFPREGEGCLVAWNIHETQFDAGWSLESSKLLLSAFSPIFFPLNCCPVMAIWHRS